MFRLNTEIFSVNVRIHLNAGKCKAEKFRKSQIFTHCWNLILGLEKFADKRFH